MTRGWSEKETFAVIDSARIAVFAHLAAKFRYIGSGAVCGSRVFDLVQPSVLAVGTMQVGESYGNRHQNCTA